jgi:hypothetical protein
MHAPASLLIRVARSTMMLVLVVASLVGAAGSPVLAQDPSVAPGVSMMPAASEPPKTMCESVADLRLYIRFLREQSLEDDGLVPVLVGAVASLAEARTLLGLIDETYRPLVDGLIGSLSALVSSIRELRDQGTLGAGLVQLGEAIVGVGTSMDALSRALREPCPLESPGASAPAAPSASPVA